MYQPKLQKTIHCPLDYGLNAISGKWKPRILCVLAEKKVLRYSTLRSEMADISDTVLSTALKELISDNIIGRQQFDEIPLRVEYFLTVKGQSVIPILQSICHWAEAYRKDWSDSPLPHCEACISNTEQEAAV
ncbi:helix-turn-helix transcriptional regulator [Blautia schinkii]|nr:helix-turn-helix transcriptional regulator [Blautia schinkii]